MKVFFSLLLLVIVSDIAFANTFDPGYYYSRDGQKVEGLIKFIRATFSAFGSSRSDILFKENNESVAKKLTTDDISSFVIGKDSFAIVRNIKINSVKGEYKEDFAKVVISGNVNLFVHMSSADNPKIDRYVLSKDNTYYLGIWNAKQQRDEIAGFFEDNPALKSRILNKEFDKDIPGLVAEYNRKK